MTSRAYPQKSFYFLGGLAEATETLVAFLAMRLWPNHFTWLAYGFAVLCAISAASRVVAGWKAFEQERAATSETGPVVKRR